jgi:hypothetical protein
MLFYQPEINPEQSSCLMQPFNETGLDKIMQDLVPATSLILVLILEA